MLSSLSTFLGKPIIFPPTALACQTFCSESKLLGPEAEKAWSSHLRSRPNCEPTFCVALVIPHSRSERLLRRRFSICLHRVPRDLGTELEPQSLPGFVGRHYKAPRYVFRRHRSPGSPKVVRPSSPLKLALHPLFPFWFWLGVFCEPQVFGFVPCHKIPGTPVA